MVQRADGNGVLLGDLLQGIVDPGEFGRLYVTGLCLDSREVVAGDLFLATAGRVTHGMAHLEEALRNGAVAVLAQPSGEWDRSRLAQVAATCQVPLFMVSDLGHKVGVIAGRLFGQPGQALRVIGVTGTNGKTSVTHFLAQVLGSRVPAGVIGTLGNGPVDDLRTATHTTPNAVAVQAELARQVRLGIKAVAMEVSSHALDQGRVNGVPFHTAVFTNLSHDHLDYHGSMAAYAAAKARLFRRPGLMQAVINIDDRMGRELLQEFSARVMTVACSTSGRVSSLADRAIHATAVEPHAGGLGVRFESSWGAGEFSSPVFGRFNAENLLLTLGVLLSWDMPLKHALEAMERLCPVPGRMDLLGGQGLPRVVVDYAHTPDALEKALAAVREHAHGQVICVFGCGGDRDRAKRPRMGAVAERLADRVILTDDNPRGEDGDTIVRQILDGMQQPQVVQVERDRARAIEQAIGEAASEDLVLVAGKGHEAWQLVGGKRIPFSDHEQVRRALQGRAA